MKTRYKMGVIEVKVKRPPNWKLRQWLAAMLAKLLTWLVGEFELVKGETDDPNKQGRHGF